MNVKPWNKSQWDDYDTEYASNKLLHWNQSKFFETIILWEVQPDVLFALNLFVTDDSGEQNGNYQIILSSLPSTTISTILTNFSNMPSNRTFSPKTNATQSNNF